MHEAELRSWLDAYGRAWETQDGDGFVALFSDDAVYSENPFDEPLQGGAAIRAYARLMERHQRDVSFGFEVVSVTPVVVLWQASYRNAVTGEATRLDGVFLLEFNDEGRCTSLRGWWHADPGPAFSAADL